MKQYLRRAASLVFSAFLLWSLALPASAASRGTLRVAFYPLDGFFEYDEQGEETGYGVELLEQLSRYTGIRFTYVPAESWESTKYMLLRGEADIRMPGTLPVSPSSTLGYTQHSILDTYYAVLTLKSREELIYGDDAALHALKVGVSASLYESAPVRNHLAEIGLSEDDLVFYNGYNECRAALQSGEVDALISNIMDMDGEMKILARFFSRANYISMTLENPYLDVLDEALFRMKLEDPTFFSNLYSKWFPERAAMPLTREETDYLASMDRLRFYFGEGQGYLSQKGQDGVFTGFYPALAQRLCENLGVTYAQYDGESVNDGQAIVVPDFYYDYDWADEQNASISEPYASAGYYEITRKGSAVDRTKATVAAVQSFRVTRDYIQSGYAPGQMLWCQNYAECLEAVDLGRADVTYVNRYTAEYYLHLYRYSALSATLTDYSHQICFAVFGENRELLASILSKSLLALSSDELNTLTVQETSAIPEQNFLIEWFYQNPLRGVLCASAAAAVVMVLLGLVLLMHRTRRQNIALRKATGVKQDFLSRMSHDMRTPMNAIIGFSRFGVESRTLAEAREYHQKICDAGEYLLQLINDTLDLSKMEAGPLLLHPEPYSSGEFIETLSNILRPKAEQKGVAFTVENELSNPETVLFDKLRLQQIFINLINNAIKFTPPGGHVTLRIDAQPGRDREITVLFSVTDDGIGMAEEFLREKLYEPFVQEHRVESTESGTGLGLSIVKELVTAMGGSITCDSAPGKGTTFQVALKTERADAPAPQEPPRGQAELSGARVLLCEDHPLNREIAVRLLQAVGISVVGAENGRIGAELFEKSEVGYFSAVLMDIRMPVMDGLEATRAIRAMERADAGTVPIIAMTANAFDEDVQTALAAGMNAHLAKPIQPQKLFQTLRACILKDQK